MNPYAMPKSPAENGKTILLLMKESQNFAAALVDNLIRLGADLSLRDADGRTALHLAIAHPEPFQEEWHGIIKSLIKAGADINATDADGCSLLHTALVSADIETLHLLLDAGANPNPPAQPGYETPLIGAIHSGQASRAIALIEAGADVNQYNLRGNTPLIVAVSRWEHDVIHSLLKHGAKIDALNINGRSALDCAIEWKKQHDSYPERIIRLLQAATVRNLSTKGMPTTKDIEAPHKTLLRKKAPRP